MSDPFVLGMDGKLYYNTSGVAGSGSWVELDNAKNVTSNLESAEADVTTRNNNGWRASTATLKDASVEFEMVWDPSDAGFTAIKNAYLNGTTIGIMALDGSSATSGSQGPKFDGRVMSFSRSEDLEEAMMVSVTIKPTYSATAPTWYTVP
jgi:hypothetical protein